MKQKLTVILLVILFACKDKDEVTDDDLNVYATRFFAEADARKATYDHSSVELKFVLAAEIAPEAGAATLDPPVVKIVKDYWTKFTAAEKEILIFHELGHAVLKRLHTDEKLPNCDLKSMMTSGDTFVYEEGSIKRAYYLDELFDRFTPYPSWGGTIAATKTSVMNDPIDESSAWEFHADNGSLHTGIKDADTFADTPNSLQIHAAAAGPGEGYWYLPKSLKNVPAGSTLVLTLKVKTKDVTGKGVWIFMQADPSQATAFGVASDFYSQILGTSDWKEVKLILNCYPTNQPPMQIFLGLDGAGSGDVWFDDIRLDYFK